MERPRPKAPKDPEAGGPKTNICHQGAPPAIVKMEVLIMFIFLLINLGASPHGMRKFLGQGSNMSHNSNLSCCSAKAGSLTCCTTRELLNPEIYHAITQRPFTLNPSGCARVVPPGGGGGCVSGNISAAQPRSPEHWLAGWPSRLKEGI